MTELHVVDQPGPSGAPLVVLVHGTMDRSNSFMRVMGLLDDASVIAYDRRGYARSLFAEPKASSVGDHVDDLLALMGGRPGVVVGHSYGADVAMAAAVRRPDLVRAVGAFEPPMPWLPWWPSDTAGGEALRAALADGDPSAAVDAFLRRMLGAEAFEMMPLKQKQERRSEGPALYADMQSLRRDDPPFDPVDVKVPVVLGYGTNTSAHQVDNAQRLLGLLPDVEAHPIDGAGHNAHATHPTQFAVFTRATLTRAG